ncbi:hypothetical protein LX59_00423 [Azomonas agilis]|uniref:Uncharacterized protein n=1 Tax=Azomonas agilis TaxID=116849 RepID=A0A562J2R2_9GAMM|nr:YbhN family protein [Azomonas agilis]TWH77506.1 hypothetical protein LX59_00423 [Azomonas agilis]
MSNRGNTAWTLVGIVAVLLSGYLLYQEVRNISLAELTESLRAIATPHWVMAGLATLGAYAALAWYDRIAVSHLGHKISWWFITLCSFTTYALAHNIGASVFSGALVRYRAYRTKGLTPQDIGILIVFCSLTFAMGTVLASGVVLLIQPELISRILPLDPWVARVIGFLMLSAIILYVVGSLRNLPPLRCWKWQVEYPKPSIVARQLLAGPLEILCAAAIIYFALPEQGNPGYITILGVFLASFSLALLSHAPGGLGVLEVTFLAALPEFNTVDMLAALIVFRGLYLLLPFALAIFVVVFFEVQQACLKKIEQR